jgi:poly(A) polymerase
LLLRYGTSPDGEIVKKAHLYVRDEHGIDPRLIDPDAVWIIKQLRREGFHAYIVGGAVRDLILGRTPNDFDVATDAFPQRIRRIFRSARIIGRRFRIVHVYFGREKFVEVTTFRSNKTTDSTNLFGTMEEDAQRRDFTINALYYSPVEQQVVDYVGGFTDIAQKRLKTLISAEESFAEDPVRMIRAVKYASLTGFPVSLGMAGLIKRMREAILQCSRERVTEEIYKILTSGAGADILELSYRLRLFDVIFPTLSEQARTERVKFVDTPLYRMARELDAETREGRELPREQMFAFLFRDLVRKNVGLFREADPASMIQQYIRSSSYPLFPSKKDVAIAAETFVREYRRSMSRATHRNAPRQGRQPPNSSPR